jgi:hypothetical protein
LTRLGFVRAHCKMTSPSLSLDAGIAAVARHRLATWTGVDNLPRPTGRSAPCRAMRIRASRRYRADRTIVILPSA